MDKKGQGMWWLWIGLLELGVIGAMRNDTKLGQGVVILELRKMTLVKGELVLSIKLQDINVSEFLTTWENRSVGNEHWIGAGSNTKCSQIAKNWGQFVQEKGTRSRKKRGALDFGGDILKSLFGVSTEKQVHSVEDRLDEKIETHTVALKKLVRLQHIQTKALESVREFVNTQAIEEWGWLTRKTVDNAIAHLCEAYDKLRIDLELGHLSPDLINLQHIEDLIKLYNIRWGLQSIANVSDAAFENTVRTKVRKFGEDRVAFLSIPFSDNTTFEMFRFVKFPMYLENRNSKVELDIAEDVLVINTLRTKYTIVNMEVIRQCDRLHRETLICGNMVLLKVPPKESRPCLLGILMTLDYTNCRYRLVHKDYVMGKKIGMNVFVTAKPYEVVTTVCNRRRTTVTNLTTAGIGIFPGNCHVHSLSIEYSPAMHKMVEGRSFGGKIRVPHAFVGIPREQEGVKAFHMNTLLEELDQTQLKTDARHTENLERQKVYISALAVTVVGVVIITGMVGIYVLYRLKGNRVAGESSGQETSPTGKRCKVGNIGG